jgi:hypothetical protein
MRRPTWPTWRRDLGVAALASALTAAALVAVGLPPWRQARADAAAARAAAEEARHLATLSEAEARRQRDLADQQFRVAREAVDQYFTAATEQEANATRPLERLRRQLLDEARRFHETL